jgi:hypothetical protein
LALICAGVSAFSSAFLGFSGSLAFSLGGVTLAGLGTSFTASFLGGSFSTGFFLTTISAASSFIGAGGGVSVRSTTGVESHNSTSTPPGALVRQLMPIVNIAISAKCANIEYEKARAVPSFLIGCAREKGDGHCCAVFMGSACAGTRP